MSFDESLVQGVPASEGGPEPGVGGRAGEGPPRPIPVHENGPQQAGEVESPDGDAWAFDPHAVPDTGEEPLAEDIGAGEVSECASLEPRPRLTGRRDATEPNATAPEDPSADIDAASLRDGMDEPNASEVRIPRLRQRKRGRALVRLEDLPPTAQGAALTGEQRLLILDTWRRSGLPAGDFATLVGISRHSLYVWARRFRDHGPAGLADHVRGGRAGSRVTEVTRRAILMLKESHPDYGCERISQLLLRGPALPVSAGAVGRVLKEAGYKLEETATHPHDPPVRRFERSAPGELWQTDLFTFVLKRQNRRVHLVAFLDDYSRFIVSYGLHASASTALVIEALASGIASYGSPKEVLTDNGPQYVTWRGKSAFTKECEKRGIRQIVARPRRPQTLGKTERFWGTLWREFLEKAVFIDLGDAVRRVGQFIEHYNFQRTHTGIDGLVPADRFFQAAPEVLKTLKDRAQGNALDLARHGEPKTPFYLVGQVGGQGFSVHAEGDRVFLRNDGGERREIDLGMSKEPQPGQSAIDALTFEEDGKQAHHE